MYYDLITAKVTPDITSFAKKFNFKPLSLLDLKGLTIIEGKDDATIRKALERSTTDILLNPQQGRGKDFMHSRNSGLNQVLCQLAHKNTIAIGITLEHCYDIKELGKIIQNIHFCRKYHVPILLFTFAENLYGLRNPLDLLSLCKTLGMTPAEATTALTGLGNILQKKNIKY